GKHLLRTAETASSPYLKSINANPGGLLE
ncbi:unnamed protein product, partial [Rotaria socialis]